MIDPETILQLCKKFWSWTSPIIIRTGNRTTYKLLRLHPAIRLPAGGCARSATHRGRGEW